MNFSDDLYYHGALKNDDFNEIIDSYNYSKEHDKNDKGKDDFKL